MFETTSPKVRRQVWGLVTNRWAFGSFAILTFQQMIEATSTLWLVLLMQSITSGEPFFHYLTLYLSALVLPYIPWCLAFVVRITWKQEAQRSFINAYVSSNRNNINEWGNKGIKEEKLSVLTAEAPTAINALIDWLFDLYAYILSVIFNIIALSIVVEPLFAFAYALSVSGVMIVMVLKKSRQRLLTRKAISARVDLTQQLLASWDNVLLGNDYNFGIWQERTTQRLNRCLRKNVELERFDQVMSIFISLMTSIPSLIVVVYFMYTHQSDPVKLSAFVVTIPILFMILSYTYQTLSLAFKWGMHKSKLIALFKAIQPNREGEIELQNKVKWDKIRMMKETKTADDQVSLATPHALSNPYELIEKAGAPGRLTLRGENGSGKSTLLMLMKDALQNRAFFLPTHSQLSFSSDLDKYSTGEALKKRLEEILGRVSADVLLLDEWDANLDNDNKEALSQLIDKISAEKCVIEVRHR